MIMAQGGWFPKVAQRSRAQGEEDQSGYEVPAPICDITVEGCEEGIEYEAVLAVMNSEGWSEPRGFCSSDVNALKDLLSSSFFFYFVKVILLYMYIYTLFCAIYSHSFFFKIFLFDFNLIWLGTSRPSPFSEAGWFGFELRAREKPPKPMSPSLTALGSGKLRVTWAVPSAAPPVEATQVQLTDVGTGKKWLIDLTGALVSTGRTNFAASRTEVNIQGVQAGR